MLGVWVVVMLAACGSVEDAETDSSVGTADAPVGGADAPLGGPDASPADAGSETMVTLEASPTLPGIAMGTGRMVVMWFQLNDDGPDPEIEVGYDVAFDPSVTTYNVPMSAITPPGEQNLLCPRSCTDEATCPCAGVPQVGIGLILLLTDPNGNGKIDVPTEWGWNGGTATVFGVTKIVIGYGPDAYVPATPYDNIFPQGILEGMIPYEAVSGAGTFDQLVPANTTTRYDLKACDPNMATTCDSLPWPNLT